MRRSFSYLDLLRYVVAFVFISSGMMKLTHPDMVHTFAKIGIPSPYYMLYFIALLEIISASLIAFNKWVRNATIPLLVIMVAALLLTKIPVLTNGIIEFTFQARLDVTMLVLLYILYRNNR